METTYKYAYEKLMAENNLTASDLNDDAKTGVAAIKQIELAINMAEKKAAKNNKTFVLSAATKAKIKAYDKWVTGEIIDLLDDKESNPDAPNVAATEIIADIKDESIVATEDIIDFSKGDAIDQELKVLFETNKRLININDLRDAAPKAYDTIHDSYKAGEENGIQTSNFLLKETATANDFELTVIK